MYEASKPGRLKELLKAIPDEHGMQLEANLKRLYPTLIYNLPPKRGDLFYRIMSELTRRGSELKPLRGVYW